MVAPASATLRVAAVLVALACFCQQARLAQGAILSYVLTASTASLEAICVGSTDPTKATMAAADYLLVGSNTSVLDGYTLCATGVTTLAYSAATGNYSTIAPSALPGTAASAGWKVSSWQAGPLDVVLLTVTNSASGSTLIVSALSSILSLLSGSTTITGLAYTYSRTFTSLPNVQSYLLASPPTALTAFAIAFGPEISYVLADTTGTFYLFEATFSSSRRRKLLAGSDSSTQGSSCVCHNNPHPAPSCVNGNSAYPGCRYICCC